MLKFAVGHSNDPDSQAAISEVLQQIRSTLAGASPNAGILFAAIDFDHALILHQIAAAFSEIELIGGTTDGEMSSVLGFEQDSLTLMVICSNQVKITAGIGCDVSEDAIAAGRLAVQQAATNHRQQIEFCITLPESLTTSGVLILDSLKQALGENVPIFGGLTADQRRSQQTYQFCHTKVYNDAVPVLLFSGPILFSHGIASGWQPIGKPGRVTKVEKNVVFEIDDQPALAFFQRYLGHLHPSAEYPLALFDVESDRHYMRAPIGINNSHLGSVTFFGDVPAESIVQITEARHHDLLLASQQSTMQALDNYPGHEPAAALFFSCASRRKILGIHTKKEYKQAQNCLKPSLLSCGFYGNGEIAPLQPKGVSHYHNETFITLLLGEL